MRKKRKGFLHRHSLSITVAIVVIALIVLYNVSSEKTHVGSFYGNAIADWTGLLAVVITTKYMYEKGSAESRTPPHPLVKRVPEPIRNHSLTIFFLVTGIGWILLFRHMESESKWGQVVGNIVSEWTQILGTVLLTKKLTESHSKESKDK